MVFGMISDNNINSMQRIYPAESGKKFYNFKNEKYPGRG